jgi:hypothetical protein
MDELKFVASHRWTARRFFSDACPVFSGVFLSEKGAFARLSAT